MSRFSMIHLLIAIVSMVPGYSGAASCPKKVTRQSAHDIISEWMKLDLYGHSKKYLAKKNCLEGQSGKYRFTFPSYNTDPMRREIDFFAKSFEILSLRKGTGSKLNTDYFVDIKVSGISENGRRIEHQEEVLFSFPKGTEAVIYGCAIFHSTWSKNFIKRECADPKLLK